MWRITSTSSVVRSHFGETPANGADVSNLRLAILGIGSAPQPEAAQYVLDHTSGIVGFFGASSLERLATEIAIRGQAEKFKAMTL